MNKKTSSKNWRYIFSVYSNRKKAGKDYHVIAPNLYLAVAKLQKKHPKLIIRSVYSEKIDTMELIE